MLVLAAIVIIIGLFLGWFSWKTTHQEPSPTPTPLSAEAQRQNQDNLIKLRSEPLKNKLDTTERNAQNNQEQFNNTLKEY